MVFADDLAAARPPCPDDRGMTRSLFDKYGGFSQVSRIVLDFYDRLLDDDDLGPYFEAIDMARIVDHQTKFIATLLGGPASYTDEQIRVMHRHLTIRPADFERLRDMLARTLADHGLEGADVDHVVAEFERRRGLVLE
jgi:hemoglobin